MVYVIDRFEGAMAVLCDEEENTRAVPRALLPADAGVHDVVVENAHGFIVDPVATQQRQEMARKLICSARRKA